MTAPAEDPRGGEACRPVCGCEQGMGHMDRGCHSYGLCHAQSAERAARSAGDRVQPTQEPSSNDVAVEDVRTIAVALGLGGHARPYSAHDVVRREILPALAALLDAQAAVSRVEALVATWRVGRLPDQGRAFDLRAALDGT